MDEVHVAFAHQPGGSHAKLSVDLPIISAEETDWGLLRFGTPGFLSMPAWPNVIAGIGGFS